MYWKSLYSPLAAISVRSPTGRMRRRSGYRARLPYDPSVSLTSITPPAYLTPSTDDPVTMGDLV